LTYTEALDFLLGHLPMYQRIGPAAFRKDLSNTIRLLERLGNPHTKFRSIHIAGTNGKGSSANLISSILQEGNYKTGLYTSPHLKSFTERIRVNGLTIPESGVIDFVEANKDFLLELKPSFFEMSVAMAFDFFAREGVDIAVVEVGLGGRLDSTNVLKPELCLITNIGFDHQDFLGNSLSEIAVEKAGIIKEGIPLVVSEFSEEPMRVFREKCEKNNSELIKAWDLPLDSILPDSPEAKEAFIEKLIELMPLKGDFQKRNLIGSLAIVSGLNSLGFDLEKRTVEAGIRNILKNNDFRGRWQVLGREPLVVCDCAHNKEGLRSILPEINNMPGKLHIVWGTVADKDVAANLSLMPVSAKYYYCQADIPRKMDHLGLLKIGREVGRNGDSFDTVQAALESALKEADPKDSIFIGGSTFVVAEVV
jgi:dihydrofolate synthase / folylpolyglutamate synthase